MNINTPPPRSLLVTLTAIACALIAALLIIGGGYLVSLNGTAYYLITGLALLVTAFLLFRQNAYAYFLYSAVLIGTLIWAVYETGLDFWALAPRLDILAFFGVWLILPFVIKHFGRGRKPGAAITFGSLFLYAIVLAIALFEDPQDVAGQLPPVAADAQPQQDAKTIADGDWIAYGRTGFGDRFSPLTQITPDNAHKLKVAWTFRTGDLPGPNDPGETTFEVTPLKVNNTLYFCTQHQWVYALDPGTGKVKWKFDPKVNDNPTFQHLTCRGVSYHETKADAVDVTGTKAPQECTKRIFVPVNDGRMIALDADTGAKCTGFGKDGELNLYEYMPVKTLGELIPTSPPVVTDKVLIVSSAVTDNYSSHEPSGVIRGYDIYNGKLLWVFDSGNPDPNQMPSATHNYSPNSPNSWITSSVDENLGLVYIPMGVQTPDIWGGNRDKNSERYASSLVALHIDTGKLAWSYQTVHHDLWDMDLPSQPSLADIKTENGIIPAIYVPAKTGNIFVLDRRSGQPIVPSPERPVPQGAAKGDFSSPTQPFSELTFRPEKKLTGADMWGASMFDQMVCRIMFHRLRYEGTFTPPSEQGTLVFPGNLGMFEWGGIAIDPVRQIAIANPIAIPFVSRLIPRGPGNPSEPPKDAKGAGMENGLQPMYGTPYAVTLNAFLSPLGIPCKKPAWGYMAGIDLKTHKIMWMHRNGTIRDVAPLPIPFKLGVPSLGGPLVTAGGVAFLTSTMDYYIRAYDVTTGKVLWEDRLPAGGQSTPMSYSHEGRQYILTADGGHGSFGTKIGDYVVAYALPDEDQKEAAKP
ncbi:glucose/quinate/shikimate family membrane-bound PQQ-dependent dehydrogenase [Entomobacter blattae]|uniref:Quinoprotein glucose dehydrogenase n=1 Tax=Entomobacter blattae TaxID=2762277 RepID=A0A7H1NRG5_9PROT|nr:glucose/quinate/shikimate family membrane-bound PQQ-dependent dehydrogenase [Entomobacter blattae]QNT78375.1 Quinoprotein glucose dehydrogenase [Entomobacter blattae]